MSDPAPAPLPDWACDVVLVDGGTVHVRPVEPADRDRLEAFHARLSPESVYYRFFSPRPTLSDADLDHLTRVDHRDRVALVAVLGDDLVGVARYERQGDLPEAEVAFVVADEHQGRGIGTMLLEHLAAAALERGITRFVAETLPGNRRMLDVFRNAGFDERARFADGVIHVELAIEPTDSARAAAEAREHRAESTSIARLLAPRGVAIIGASRNPAAVGYQVLANVIGGGYAGGIYPVNPNVGELAGRQAFATVADVPGDVDLAVIAVPAASVPDVVRSCAAKGVRGIVVLSAGFGELGADGRAAQHELNDLVRRNGMRLVGPNCIGVVNTAVLLNATFAPYTARPGRIAMQSQSGALGIALLERSERIGLGISTFVSVGNKADVSGNDLLQFWEDDPTTDVVLLYLESFGNPRKFSRIARRVSRRKPIVAVKSGRSDAGVRAASSHTAAMASPDTAVDALFHQTGVIRVDTVDQLFDMALLLGTQPVPAGRRVAIVGNSGGPGILATDACAAAGLDVPELSPPTQAALRAVVDPNAAVANPVDLVASATPAVYEQALRIVLADDSIHAVVVVSTPTFAAPSADVADVLRRLEPGKPVVGCFIAARDVPPLLARSSEGAVPTFSSPEPAVRALARAAEYGEWRRRPSGSVPELDDFDADGAQEIVERALTARPSGGWLEPALVQSLLDAAGIASVRSVRVSNAAEAEAASIELGGPVALKAEGPMLVHKSDVGGVRLDLETAPEVAAAFEEMHTRLGDRMTGGIVQPMVAAGVETIVGVVQDPLFGPLVMFGLGGVATELLGDRAFRILPLTDRDAAELVRSLRSSELLFGYRGAPRASVESLEMVLLRIAQLAGRFSEIAELDLNPVSVHPDGATVVDARVRVAPVGPS